MQIGIGISLTARQNLAARAVLNTLSAASAAAYSPRKLSDNYTGSAIRVRRSTDNVEADIGFLPNGDLDVYALMNHVGAENLLLWSQDFSNAVWTKANAANISGGVTAPDGTNTAFKLKGIAGTALTPPDIRQTVTFGSGASQVSFYAKAGEKSWVAINSLGRTPTDADVRVYFNLSTGTVGSSINGGVGSIQAVGNGWYRCSLLQTGVVAASTQREARIMLVDGDGSVVFSSTGTEGVYVWGAQFNSGSTVQDYCKTTSAPTTAGSGFTTTAYDQSGNGRNLVQATAANQPRIVNAGVIDRIGTRAAYRTDGVSQTLATGSFVIAQPFTRSSVLQFLKIDGAATPAFLNSSAASPNTSLYNDVSGSLAMFAGVGAPIKAGIVINDKATVVETYNGASSSGSYNGASSAINPGTQGIDGASLGRDNTSTAFSSAMFGDILIFPIALTTSDRLVLEANQKAYWGTP